VVGGGVEGVWLCGGGAGWVVVCRFVREGPSRHARTVSYGTDEMRHMLFSALFVSCVQLAMPPVPPDQADAPLLP
jgi:hypothetical protein